MVELPLRHPQLFKAIGVKVSLFSVLFCRVKNYKQILKLLLSFSHQEVFYCLVHLGQEKPYWQGNFVYFCLLCTVCTGVQYAVQSV